MVYEKICNLKEFFIQVRAMRAMGEDSIRFAIEKFNGMNFTY